MTLSTNELASYLQVESINEDTAQLLLDLADALVVDLVGATLADHPRVVPITLEVAARGYRNANGYASERVDDYQYQRASGTSQAGIYLTEHERATLLAVKAGRPMRSVRSVKMRSASAPWPAGVIEER